MSVVIVRARRGRSWEAWAVDRSGADTGLNGASRVVRGWRSLGYAPFTEDLARVVGLFAFPAAEVFTARTVVEFADGPRWTSAPSLAPPLADGSRVLSLSYRDASGALRVASFRVDASGEVRPASPGAREGGR